MAAITVALAVALAAAALLIGSEVTAYRAERRRFAADDARDKAYAARVAEHLRRSAALLRNRHHERGNGYQDRHDRQHFGP